MYKVFHEMHPTVVVNLFTKLSSVHSHNLTKCVNNDYYLPCVSLGVCVKDRLLFNV